MSNVTHPSHYNSGKIEVIEAIEDWKLNFHRGNAVKYTARAGKKDASKEIEDLEKAVWYLNREIEVLKAKNEARSAIRPNAMNPQSISATDALNSNEPARQVDIARNALDEICYACDERKGAHYSGKCANSTGVFVPTGRFRKK